MKRLAHPWAALRATAMAFSAGPALAQDLAADCVALLDDSARLACDDRLHQRPAAASSERVTAAPAVQALTTPTAPAATSPGRAMPAPTLAVTEHTLATRWDLDGHRGSLFAPRAYRPDRLVGALALRRGDWIVQLRPWLRIPEQDKDDDNPDIEDHVGRGELVVGRYWGNHAPTLQLRHSLRGGQRSRGSAQLDWVFPLSGALHGYFQVFSGSGESLVDYNQKQTKIGLGVTIAGWR